MNVLLVVQITVYLLALVLALCISVPVIIHQQDFKYFSLVFFIAPKDSIVIFITGATACSSLMELGGRLMVGGWC